MNDWRDFPDLVARARAVAELRAAHRRLERLLEAAALRILDFLSK